MDVHGDLAVTASQKAEALNSQFSSVFTMDDGNLPDFSQRSRDHLFDINLSVCYLISIAVAQTEYLLQF